MFYLKNAAITGEGADVKSVIELFGKLYVGDVCDGKDSIQFKIKRFTNVYRDYSGKSPLYVLIPNKYLNSVWPESIEYEEIKYGTSYTHMVPLLVIHLESKVGLLVCLTPEGDKLTDRESFGI